MLYSQITTKCEECRGKTDMRYNAFDCVICGFNPIHEKLCLGCLQSLQREHCKEKHSSVDIR